MYSKLAVVAAVLLVAVVGTRAEEYNCMAEGRVCQNGGVCHENALQTPESGAGNGWTTPFCVCQAPWGGPDCSHKIRECKDSPCQNGATCVAADCLSSSSQYDCFSCQCARGWTGAPSAGGSGLCDWKLRPYEDCTATTCANGGTCSPYQANGYDSYQCACTAGYRGGNPYDQGQLLNRPWNCTVPDCTLTAGACLNGGACVGTTCSCVNGYWGDRCEKAPFCASMPCTNGWNCTNGANGGGSCDAPPFCASNPCGAGATCNNGSPPTTPGSCSCVAPADGQNSCNATQFCASNPCQNGGSCTNTLSPHGGAGFCTCVPGSGYAGFFCEEQIKGCGFHNNGFPIGCAPNAAGCSCTDQASCASSNFNTKCGCGGAAPGEIFYYDCRCNSTATSKCPGRSGMVTGQNADMVCQNGGTCEEGLDVTACSCRPGFWGDKCQNYDNPCLNNPCENGGQCYMTSETSGVPLDDRFWAYRCRCKWPFYGKNCGQIAPIPGADGAAPTVCGLNNSPCQNGATCVTRGYSTSSGGYFYNNPWTGKANEAEPWRCVCPLGWTGVTCDTPVDRCTATTCQNGGHCIDGTPAPTCTCPCGYSGDRCEVPASNAAANSLAQFAADGAGGVGYSLEFCSREPCQNGGTCYHATSGQDFGCLCKSGYSGTYCQYRVRSAATGVVPSLIAVAAAVAVAFALKH